MDSGTSRNHVLTLASTILKTEVIWRHVQDVVYTVASSTTQSIDRQGLFCDKYQDFLVQSLYERYFADAGDALRDEPSCSKDLVLVRSLVTKPSIRKVTRIAPHETIINDDTISRNLAFYAFDSFKCNEQGPLLHAYMSDGLVDGLPGDMHFRPIVNRQRKHFISGEQLPCFLWMVYAADRFSSVGQESPAHRAIIACLQRLHDDLRQYSAEAGIPAVTDPAEFLSAAYDFSLTIGTEQNALQASRENLLDDSGFARLARIAASNLVENIGNRQFATPSDLSFTREARFPDGYDLQYGTARPFVSSSGLLSGDGRGLAATFRLFYNYRAIPRAHGEKARALPGAEYADTIVNILSVMKYFAYVIDTDEKFMRNARFLYQCEDTAKQLYGFYAATEKLFASEFLALSV